MQLQADQLLYVRLYGKNVRVTSVFIDEGDGPKQANRHMEDHPDEGVISVFGRLILLAKVTDMGE